MKESNHKQGIRYRTGLNEQYNITYRELCSGYTGGLQNHKKHEQAHVDDRNG